MIRLRTFRPDDVLALDLQPTQAVNAADIDIDYGRTAAKGEAWTAFDDATARIVGCGGIVPVFATQGLAWALFASGIGHGFTIITRQARDALRASPLRRIEAIVRADFAPAARWALAIGLVPNGLLRNWGPTCEDHLLFERVRL